MQNNTFNDSRRKFAVVTGASSGIGLELAKLFAQNGFDLLIAAQSSGIETAAGALNRYDVNVQALQVDLATRDGVNDVYAAIKASGRPVDALVLNAGVGAGGPFVETDLEKEQNIIDLNITSVVRLAKYVVKAMHERNQGRILFTASVVSEMPGPFQAVYAASKAFVLSFAVALRNELRDTNITVTALQPGATETNFFHRAGLDDTKVGQSKKDDPAEVARQGFEAMMAGKETVVAASFKTKMLGVAENILPGNMKAEMHRSMSEPGKGKKAG
jgi:uncharacterized protein